MNISFHKLRLLWVLLVLMALFPITAFPYDFQVDGFYYNKTNSNEVAVTSGDTRYSGNIVIPERVIDSGVEYSVTSIDDFAFFGLSGLTSVTIGNSVTSIGTFAFGNCVELTTLDIPCSVTTINKGAFYGCSELTSIEIPNTVTYLGESVFNGCSLLSSVILPNTITSIKRETFLNCIGLKSIEIPQSVTLIDKYAFENCSSLTSLKIPNSVTEIKEEAFKGCAELSQLTFMDGNSTLKLDDLGIFFGCALETLYIGRNIYYPFYSSPFSNNKSTLKSIIIGNYVTNIWKYAFCDCSALTSIDIPDSVSDIGESAFKNCIKLNSIAIPKSVTSIGNDAFYGCSELKNLIFESGELALQVGCNNKFKGLFYDSPLETVYIGRNLTYNSSPNYCYSPFCGSENLTAVVIGPYVTELKSDYFKDCVNIKDVTFEDGSDSIYLTNGLFLDCRIKTLYIGRNLSFNTYNKYETPFYNSELTSVTIGNSVTEIESYTFFGCSGLTSIEIPNSVTSIGYSAFSCCTGLTSFEFPNSITSIGSSVMSGCSGLTSVTIPNSVKSIGSSAFRDCSGLTSVTIPNSVTSIGESAFCDCSGLTAVTIPISVTSIGNNAYSGCNNLTDIRFQSYFIDNIASSGLLSSKLIYLIPKPDGTFNDFEKCNLHYYFTNIMALYDNLPFVIVKSSDALSFSNTYYREDQIVLVHNEECVATANDHTIKAIHKEKDITAEILSSEGYTFMPSTKLDENIFVVYGEDKNGVSSLSVELKEAGTLFNEIGLQNIEKVEVIKIIGDINGTDVMIINRMKSLKYLDLYDANIVEGGVTYRENLKTSNDIVGSHFFDDINLEVLYLPNSAKEIASEALYMSSSLKILVICGNVTTIGERAFLGCSGLIYFTIPNSVTSIGHSALNGCTGVKELTIEDGTETLRLEDNNDEKGLFYDCPLEKLYLGRNLSYCTSSSFSYSPFYGKATLTSLTIGNLVTSIEYATFYRCSGLTTVTIPNSVTLIENHVFNGCTGLKELTIEDGTETLSLGYNNYNHETGKGLFYDCPLENLYLGRNLTYNSESKYGYSPFYGKDTLTSITIGDLVAFLRDYTFSSCTGMISITIPISITTIGENVFSGCTGLTSVTIGNSVASIGRSAFNGCSGLTSVTIPNSVISIGNSAFFGCTGLTSVTLGNSVDRIGESAFKGCTGLIAITIPNSITSIGNSAFFGCTGLTSVTIGNSVVSIGNSVFNGCSALSSIIVPNSVTEIGYSAFRGCSGLTSIIIPDSVTSIGKAAFYGCSGLTSISIPNSITSIEDDTFNGCSGLTFVSIPNSVTSIGRNTFSGCSSLTEISIPNSINSIGSSAFYGCIGLTSVNIPNSVTSIGSSAFNYCSSLTSVTIGKSVTSIGDSAFGNCKNIEKVISLNTTPPEIQSSTFDSEVEESAKLHVQKGSLVHYWLDPVWKEFLNMAEDVLCLDVIPDATYGDGEIDLAQYAPNGVALTYETSNEDVVRINGDKMQIVGAGEATVGAILGEGDSEMELIGQMRQFRVEQADLTVSVANIEIKEGEPLPDFTYLVDGLQYDDTLDDIEELPQPICEATDNSPAGEYPVTFTDGKDRNYKITTLPAMVTIGISTGVETISENSNSDYIKVYDMNGIMVYEGLRSEACLKHGIYIVTNGKSVIKVYVK